MSDPRTLLALADREQRIANAADSLIVSFRVRSKVAAVRPGRFAKWFQAWHPTQESEWRPLTDDESQALYRAALIVRKEAEQKAREYEAQVTTKSADR